MSNDLHGSNGQSYDAKAFESLSEAAFLADSMGLQKDADQIFDALHGMKSSSPYPVIGKAFGMIRAGNFADASKLLKESALPLDENNNDVKSFLALSLQLEGKMGERDEVCKSMKDPSPAVASFVENLKKGNQRVA